MYSCEVVWLLGFMSMLLTADPWQQFQQANIQYDCWTVFSHLGQPKGRHVSIYHSWHGDDYIILGMYLGCSPGHSPGPPAGHLSDFGQQQWPAGNSNGQSSGNAHEAEPHEASVDRP